MSPRLTTDARLAPLNASRPAMKSASLIDSVEATRPPTFTDAPLPNRMPLGLTRNTRPLAERLPKIADGSAPSTRLSATELLVGCLNCTDSPAAMPKPCQLMVVFALPCVMVVVLPLVVMVAVPAATTPPDGAACSPVANAASRQAASGRIGKEG